MSTAQQPIGSGFGAASTAANVIEGHDLQGRLAIVTGGYSGIGLETTRHLAEAGATVIVPARDIGKAAQALQGITGVEQAALDLLDPGSISAFADHVLAKGRPIDLLINNAGIMATPLIRDQRGLEAQFATNHLGHFQLTTALWPALMKSGNSRVVTLSSRGHFFSPMVFEDPHFKHRAYEPYLAYGQSKTANILFTVALDTRGIAEGVRAFAVHPGTVVGTDLKRSIDEQGLKAAGLMDEHGQPVLDPAKNRKTISQGAATTVWCATNLMLDGRGGVYCENCDVAAQVPNDAVEGTQGALNLPTGVMPYAIGVESAERLWRLSEALLAPGHA
ncbi:SDR family NAD(P)-dependent oxidoreductase [Mesorhizobium sp. CO1-1-4]|uniref:SDR family NAD(P)-dependent oxidoreductase n=1 Tax=Mesorhizobium sp. CO1-1-4 TaxID=2876633 RepID=UPI001CD037F0|nr:SDR family NAD(P)-dependent oxidoreductase [Mesorhizobium sp. CO1-1-4]MBZ9738686.1 SDR family NAD(P)-dependent oxidoreductase [Mesorhizobium sp. CO1-1-4]